MESQQTPQTPQPLTVEQINRMLDTLDENMLNLSRSVSDYAERHSWIDPLTLSGLEQIEHMKRRYKELQEERRQLYAATTVSLAS